jgi:dTDP-4-amino-4,6-dideoxygalactose transaminase
MNNNPKTAPVFSVDSAPLLDVGRGNQPLKAEIMESISQIIDSGRFIGGPFVEFLEQSVAEACDAKYAIGCASGSDALLLALMAIDLQPGDEVICPSFTFFATASAIHRLGGVAVFVDIKPGTFNLDPQKLVSLITKKTKAIIPVHLFGQCADMQPIMAIAAEHGLRVIEDCAQSIGAAEKGQPCGAIGDIGCFSFYPTKNLGGFGDGGMLTSNDDQLADRLRLLANHGMRPRYHHSVVGINSRLDAIQAAALCAKMKHLDSYSAARQKNAATYETLFAEAGLTDLIGLPVSKADCNHVWNQFTVRIPESTCPTRCPGETRDLVRAELAKRNVGSEVYYPVPLHQQECFEHLNVPLGSLAETEKAAAEVLSLPIYPELTCAEQAYVVQSLTEVLAELNVSPGVAAA